jgi:hypothetical protein
LRKKILILPKTSSNAVSTGGNKAATSRTWLRAGFLLVILVTGFLGLSIFFSKAALVRKKLPSQGETNSVAKQLSSLTQSDLIVFSDGRVWYVRGVQGNNIEIVGWIGENAKSEDIDSFVNSGEHFTIVHQNDPKWAEARDRFFKQ